ncbi:MAG: DUF748 domain-containing protein [Magnetococcales bacterium]|nr:DUF748 domain-containing protein [Magnetococcales bacterium]
MTRLTAVLLTSLAFILGAAFHWLVEMVDPDQYREEIRRTLEAITGYRVAIKEVDLAPSGGLQLALHSLEISSWEPGDPPLLTVERAYLGLDWQAFMIDSRLKATALHLTRPHINLVMRPKRPLLQRAQESARWSSREMKRLMGQGLPEISVARFTIREGTVALLDQSQADQRTWTMDHLQVQINQLSPLHASPVNISGRIQEIPFKVNGQVGPLPPSLDPLDMPLLLSLEAKTTSIASISQLLHLDPFNPDAERGYFSTLFHGDLRSGLQTSSWMELRRLRLADPQTGQGLPPIDLALRQKSTARVEGQVPRLDVQEFFLYKDDGPFLNLSGAVRKEQELHLNLTLASVLPLELDPFPHPPQSPLHGGTLSGQATVGGSWPSGLQLAGQVDLTGARVIHAGLVDKAVGIPLNTEFRVTWGSAGLTLGETLLHTGDGSPLRLAGTLKPDRNLTLEGEADLARLKVLFPTLAAWEAEGRVTLNLHSVKAVGQSSITKGTLEASNLLLGGTHRVEKLTTPLQVTRQRLEMNDLRLESAAGVVRAGLVVELGHADPVYHVVFNVTGANLEQLLPGPEQTSLLGRLTNVAAEESPIRLEGLLFADGVLWGTLDERWLPSGLYSGRANARLEPGRLLGIDGAGMLEKPADGQTLFQEGKSFYWNRATAEIAFSGGNTRFDALEVDAPGITLTGEGSIRHNGTRSFNITLRTDWWGPDQPVSGRVVGNHRQLTFRKINPRR